MNDSDILNHRAAKQELREQRRPYRMELMRQVRAGEITLAEAKRLAVKGDTND